MTDSDDFDRIDADVEYDDEAMGRARLRRLGLDRCRCHSASEEPCEYCSQSVDDTLYPESSR